MYWIDLELENKTRLPQTILIPKGTVFEVKDSAVREQCLVVERDTNVTIPSGIHVVKLPAYCMNQDLSSPHRALGQLTSFRMVAAFESQDEVWEVVGAST